MSGLHFAAAIPAQGAAGLAVKAALWGREAHEGTTAAGAALARSVAADAVHLVPSLNGGTA